MLIKCVNGQMMFDEIQSTEKIMSDQIREWEGKEEEMIERTKGIWLGIIETRKEINAIKQRRAAKVWWVSLRAFFLIRMVNNFLRFDIFKLLLLLYCYYIFLYEVKNWTQITI